MTEPRNFAAVVTTIQAPTDSLTALCHVVGRVGGSTIVVGDLRGPTECNLPNCEFLSYRHQLQLEIGTARAAPTNHYARKNIGYLRAIAGGAECIYETDDDNRPNDAWKIRSRNVSADDVSHSEWVNAYGYFSDAHIWPRGFPLNRAHRNATLPPLAARSEERSPIQQGLADGSPDVDAIWRMLLDEEFEFRNRDSIRLLPGSWCPFNSQSTWWWKEAYPLLYLPSHCSFRMTDIWRSLVAQRCLWAMGCGVVFHAAEVYQQRNPHNLNADFQAEVDGYCQNERIAEILENLSLESKESAVARNLRLCYGALVEAAIFPREELQLLETWIEDLHQLEAQTSSQAA